MTMKLLAWGWISALFFVPESAAAALFERWPPAMALRSRWWFTNLVAAGGALNILMLVTANLIGFSAGLGGASHIATELLTKQTEAATVLVGTAVTLYNGVLVMLELRASEAAKKARERAVASAKRN